MANYLTLIPAYGRDYKTAAAVKTAWAEGKDFQIATCGPDDGRMINVADSRKGDVLNIRSKGLTQICQIKGGPIVQKTPKKTMVEHSA
jgi:hypothetical protein